MALVNCYRYEQTADGTWSRSGGVYKIRPRAVVQGQQLGFNSFKLQRLLIGISTEFAKLHAQFRGHLDKSALNAIRGVITEAGLVPADAPKTLVLGTDDLEPGKQYSLKLLVVDNKQALGVAATCDAASNVTCVSCGQLKARPKMDPQVKSHSVIPASFWLAIIPSGLAAIGVEKVILSGDDGTLKNSMINAGADASGNYYKPGADAQAISMCSDCESRQADFSLLQRHEKGERWLRISDNQSKEAEIRTFIGTQFLAKPTGIGERDEMIGITYNVARRVAGALERQIFSALEKYIKSLPPDTSSPTTPQPHKRPVTITTGKFGSRDEQSRAMRQQVLPQTMKEVSNRSVSTAVGFISREARDSSARESLKARQWVDHVSLKAGLEVWWSGFKIDDDMPLKAKLEQIGTMHGARRAKRSWRGLPGEPPLAVYLAQNIDSFLQAVVEMAVLFSGLTRRDQTKDENVGVVKV
jgi:hypothetical protein